MECSLVDRYWAHTPEMFAGKMGELTARYPGTIERFELCRNNVGDPVPGFRMGTGPAHVVLLGRMHGHEPVGTCGLTAIMEGLASGRSPDTGLPFPAAGRLLDRLTLHLLPMMNPDAARRFASQVPESFPGEFFTYGREDSERYRVIHSEPGITLGRDRPPHFSEEEMAVWRKTGRQIRSLFTEGGVELWMDWEAAKAPQTRALQGLIREVRPSLFVDVHAWETDTALLTARAEGVAGERSKRLAGSLYEALGRAGLPYAPGGPVPDLGGNTTVGPEWVQRECGAAAFLYEVANGYLWYDPARSAEDVRLPVVTKEQIILSVWHGITALLEGVLAD